MNWSGLVYLFIVFGIPLLVMLYRKSRLKDFMLFVREGELSTFFSSASLTDSVKIAQSHLPYEFQILTPQEHEYALAILRCARAQLNSQYSLSSGLDWLVKKSRALANDNSLFMFFLVSYLSEHHQEHSFAGHDIYTDIRSDQLSPFGCVFFKLYHIAYVFCASSRHIPTKEVKFSHPEILTSIIQQGRASSPDFYMLWR